MKNSYYVISIKRVRADNGAPIVPEEQFFEYFTYDRGCGSFSSGLPCLSSYLDSAMQFASLESAMKKFEEAKSSFEFRKGLYNLSTLAVRKVKTVFEEQQHLEL